VTSASDLWRVTADGNSVECPGDSEWLTKDEAKRVCIQKRIETRTPWFIQNLKDACFESAGVGFSEGRRYGSRRPRGASMETLMNDRWQEMSDA